MNPYPAFDTEKERLKELFSYQILDSCIEKEFEDLVQIAARIFNVQVAAITFIDASRQWIKAGYGLDICQASRDIAICNHTILQNDVLEIEDLQQDDRFKHFSYVAEAPFYRYYAGMPLITRNGYKIGVFCISDVVVHKLNEEDLQTFRALARQAMSQVELRLHNRRLENLNEKQRQLSSRLSHDLKNPLFDIKNTLGLQEKSDNLMSKADASQLYRMLEKQVESTRDIIDNMITWGKLHIYDNREYINVRQLVSDAVSEVEADCYYKQNILVNAVPANSNANVDCQGARFALRNLLTNANKFTSYGCITVSHEHKQGKDYIHVADTGVGIHQEQTDRLNSNKEINFSYGTNNEKGNGLGIKLLHDYLAQQGGQLFFKSEIGKGTKATFTL